MEYEKPYLEKVSNISESVRSTYTRVTGGRDEKMLLSDIWCEESHEEMAHLKVGKLWVGLIYEGFLGGLLYEGGKGHT